MKYDKHTKPKKPMTLEEAREAVRQKQARGDAVPEHARRFVANITKARQYLAKLYS